MPPTKNPVCEAVRRLRVNLGDTQQGFAHRLGLAISTVVRYELSRPPRGKALAQLERVAMDHGFDECALVFRNALREELGGGAHAEQVRPPTVGKVGFIGPPQTPEEEAMVFDVVTTMRMARDGSPPSIREQAKRDLKLLFRATKVARTDRIEGVEDLQADLDQTAAIIRLHNHGLPAAEIAERLNLKGNRVWTDKGSLSKVEAVLAEHANKRAREGESK